MRHFKRKVISQLCRADKTTLTIDNDILQECVDFYSELYSSRPIHNYNDNLEFFQVKILCGSMKIPKHPVKVF